MTKIFDPTAVPIPEISLPVPIWKILSREGIASLEQLQALEDGLERLPGIGVTYAMTIRRELARVVPLPTQ